MDQPGLTARWIPGVAPVAVLILALNEAHQLEGLLENLQGFAQEVFLVDSLSRDETVTIALRYGVTVVQRRFTDFGDQWNFALRELPITAPWTLKLDPDERLTDALKAELLATMARREAVGLRLPIRLHFMTRPLPVRLTLLRAWRTGAAHFSATRVNEHAHVAGPVVTLRGEIAHHDSPDLHHWWDKQNRYTTAEALSLAEGAPLADTPRLFGTALQRRMWLKRHFFRLPGRYQALFLYYWLIRGTWRAGFAGYAWAHLRAEVMRLREFKRREMALTGRPPRRWPSEPGEPDPRVPQA
ncbi:MAG: glycosyltransferase family 2 protein [Candidatus Sericytochromatia bacterium]|nr:glycosyltransferase family 2 protein [Candidatus Sericytochromatia bacterium]